MARTLTPVEAGYGSVVGNADPVALLNLLGRGVPYYPKIAHIFGGANVALMLSMFFYWRGKGKDLEGWIYKTQAEIEDETGLTPSEQKGARSQLRKIGILTEKKRGIPATNHYQVDWHTVVFRLLNDNPYPETHAQASDFVPTGENKKHSLSSDFARTNTKNTTKSTQKDITAPSKSKAPPDPNVKVFIDWWCNKHLAIIGEKYFVQGARDGAAVKTLLSNYSIEKVKTVAETLLRTKEAWYIEKAGRTIPTLYSQWNKLSNKGVSAQEVPSVPVWHHPDAK